MCSLLSSDCFVEVLTSDPPWLHYPLSHLHASLASLSRDLLRSAALRVCPDLAFTKVHDKLGCIDSILDDFVSRRSYLSSCVSESIYGCLRNLSVDISPDSPRSLMISTLFEAVYGPIVASSLRRSSWPANEFHPLRDDSILNDIPWLTDDLSPWMRRVPRKLSIDTMKMCLQSMHPSTRPIFKYRLKQSCWHAILRHMKERG
jgi:hypothetical protein